ncbi:MAG: DMT family transporter [Rickettsiella sp.]|nr:DMT family transporter [Rickettsiella sp.]
MKLSSKANLYLSLATLMWGITFPLIRNALTEVDPFVFVSVRFVVATLVLLPMICTLFYKTTKAILLGSLIIGMLNAAAYLCQTIGLETVSSARAAFITGSSVIFVPFIAPLFKLDKPGSLDFLCALIGFSGLYVLTDLHHIQLSSGDLWVFFGAISFSLQIAYLQRLTQAIQDYKLLAFYQIFFTIPFVSVLTKGHDFSSIFQPKAMFVILFCAIFATSLTYYLQNKYQKFTSAPKAALIFALEPVFASLFGFFINHELLSKATIYGGLLLLLSLVLPSLISIISQSYLSIR